MQDRGLVLRSAVHQTLLSIVRKNSFPMDGTLFRLSKILLDRPKEKPASRRGGAKAGYPLRYEKGILYRSGEPTALFCRPKSISVSVVICHVFHVFLSHLALFRPSASLGSSPPLPIQPGGHFVLLSRPFPCPLVLPVSVACSHLYGVGNILTDADSCPSRQAKG